ncbi:unnamed protein product [Clonostachys rosea]|uniref:PA14 domain-containing protein n=1 Tax=Bionectria ochroleuca TaxID=29856 RepID=A0ABY6UMM2_BIOOC|nr:unnamed protein product [Clonostachys rosea]
MRFLYSFFWSTLLAEHALFGQPALGQHAPLVCEDGSQPTCGYQVITIGDDCYATYTTNGTGTESITRTFHPNGPEEYGTVIVETPCEPTPGEAVTSRVPGPKPGTTTIPPSPGCQGQCYPTVVVTTVPHGNVFTTDIPGPKPGTTTIFPPADCTTDCATIVRVTTPTPPLTGVVTTLVPGPTPGTSTIPPGPGCREDCTTTVEITTVPSTTPTGGIITTSVPGTKPGTTTIPPSSGCIKDCTTTVEITTTPSAPPTGGIITTSVPGTKPGTTTIPPSSGCTEDCTTTVEITTTPSAPPTTPSAPPTGGIITTSVPGTKPGTTTIPPSPGCTEECTTTVEITTTPSAPPTTPSAPPSTTSSAPPSSTSSEPPSTTSTPPNAGCTSKCDSASGTGLTVKYFLNAHDYGYGNYTAYSGVPSFDGQTPRGQTTANDLKVPYQNGRANYVAGSTRKVYDLTVDSNNFTIEYTGYFEPQASGEYTVCTNADDISNLYIDSGSDVDCSGGGPFVGDFHVSTERASGGGDTNQVCRTTTLVAGYLYPFREVWGQIQAASFLNVTIQAPGGQAQSSFPGYFYPVDTDCIGGGDQR